MKRTFFLIGALCVSAMFVSCVNDEESEQSLAIRQANADKMYINMYTDAVGEIKSLEADLATNQRALDDLKDGLITTAEARDILVDYYTKLISVAESERNVHAKNGGNYLNTSDFADEYSYNRYKYGNEEAWGEYINDLKENIDEANNAYTDVETLIKMYQNVIEQIKAEIEFQKMIAERARKYFGFTNETTAE